MNSNGASRLQKAQLIFSILAVTSVVLVSCGGERTTGEGSANIEPQSTETTAPGGNQSEDGGSIHDEEGTTVNIEGDSSRMRVRAPGVRVDTDGEGGGNENVDIDLPGVHVHSGKSPIGGGTKVRVPGVNIDTDDSKENVDIKVPFVHIQKNRNTGSVDVKTPFVNIHTKDD